jgi:transcriptional regulator with XRE-family HTH domain
MTEHGRLGDFLRARRDRVTPAVVGIPDLGRRRVPGLRRDELAMLAGVSTEYYTRLEHGRDTNPSSQVLDALADALGLDPEARGHLHGLARPPQARPRRRRRAGAAADRPPDRPLAADPRLREQWPWRDPCLQRPGAGALARLLPRGQRPAGDLPRRGDAGAHRHDWERITADVVAALRLASAEAEDDEEITTLVGEISVKSERFRTLWARHDVRQRAGGGVSRLEHPQVGLLELGYEKLAISGTEDLTLVLYSAEPDSPSARGLALLASLAADPVDSIMGRDGADADRLPRSPGG